jgi:glucokinase
VEALAIEIGHNGIRCASVRDDRIVAQDELHVAAGVGRLGPLLPDLTGLLRDLLTRARSSAVSCQGLAIALPCTVDPHRLRVFDDERDSFEDLNEVDFRGWCREEFGLPLRMDHRSRVVLQAERYAGAARGCNHVVMFELGRRITSAVMIDGRLPLGKRFRMGTGAAHVVVRPGGRDCPCGNAGCLEAELPHAGRDEAVKLVGSAVVTAAHCYDPELVLIGGDFPGRGDGFLPELEQHVRQRLQTPESPVVRLGYTELGAAGALLGSIPLLLNGSY